MKSEKQWASQTGTVRHSLSAKLRSAVPVAVGLLTALAQTVGAVENAPRRPFAQWANLPEPGQFVISPWYMESEAYHMWRGQARENINVIRRGEDYGVDAMQGVIGLQYGLSERWAVDLNVGVATVGTRSFNATGDSESTTGLMDTSMGVRYQISHEATDGSGWVPTLTFRAGGVVPGSYNKHFPFAPGNHSAAIEPSLLLQKHFGWQGFGAYGDTYYRWMRTSGDDQYLVATGFFQEIQRWTLNVGYRHFQGLSGVDIGGTGNTITYSPQVKEISESIEAGFNYRTASQKCNYGFHMRKALAGRNVNSALWLGFYADFAFGGKGAKP